MHDRLQSVKEDKDRNTTAKIQQIWKEEAGIELTPDQADSLASNLSAFFDLLIEWDKKTLANHKKQEEDENDPCKF